MTTTSLTRRLAIAGAAALAMVTVTDTSALAVTITDGDGVDYDAACLVSDPFAPPPGPTSVGSPGAGCRGLNMHDGRTDATDLSSVSLSSQAVYRSASDRRLVATFTVDGPIPAAGSRTPPLFGGIDLSDRVFQGAGIKVLFQNATRQISSPIIGCSRMGSGTPIYSHLGSWKDGFHFFIGFDVTWNGLQWIYSAKIGTYDPSPAGGFIFQELGVDYGSGWTHADWNASYGWNWDVSTSGNTVTVSVDGVVQCADLNCVGGTINTVYAKAGDRIINVKGLTSADELVVLPVTLLTGLIPGLNDITTVGGFIFFSDTTAGGSGNFGTVGSTLQQNIGGIAYTPGAAGRAAAGEWLGLFNVDGSRYRASETYGSGVSMPDTLGPGPRCWTPTFGGLVPINPLWVPDQACHFDDDNIPWLTGNIDPGERGTFLPEFWDTNYGFFA